MLGVAVYLTKPALLETLRFVAALPRESAIVFSYSVAPEMLTRAQRQGRAAAAAQVAALGEPWISYYHPAALAAEANALGFRETRDLGPTEANRLYFGERDDGLRVTGTSRLMMLRV